MNRDMHVAMESRGIPHSYAEIPGAHDWDFVNRALPAALSFVQAGLS
ncbi:hypothetical protein GCM10029964_029190 [Kibdelosporangium lantanae]